MSSSLPEARKSPEEVKHKMANIQNK